MHPFDKKAVLDDLAAEIKRKDKLLRETDPLISAVMNGDPLTPEQEAEPFKDHLAGWQLAREIGELLLRAKAIVEGQP